MENNEVMVTENTNFMDEGTKEFGIGLLVGVGASLLGEKVLIPAAKWVVGKIKNAVQNRKSKGETTEELTVVEEIEE